MSDIGPGDWVECVNTDPEAFAAGCVMKEEDKQLSEGALYVVSDVFCDRMGRTSVLVGWERLNASLEHGYRCGWGLFRFKPIHRPSQSQLLTRLMDPSEFEEPKRKVEA